MFLYTEVVATIAPLHDSRNIFHSTKETETLMGSCMQKFIQMELFFNPLKLSTASNPFVQL